MKCAVISDIHLGDPTAVMNPQHPDHDYYYGQFKEIVCAGKKNDYLVLLGDIFDFAVSNYDNTYRVAQGFLKQIQDDNIADKLIYATGNHDHDLWHIVENQVNSVRQIEQVKSALPFNWAIPGVLDDRKGLGELVCDPCYNNLFMNHLTKDASDFTVVNPNLYLISSSGESYLLTHGQYFDFTWSFLGKWAGIIFGSDLTKNNPLNLMQQIVGSNFPVNQLVSEGIGQAEPALTHLIQQLQQDMKEHRYDKINEYIANIGKYVTKNFSNKLEQIIVYFVICIVLELILGEKNISLKELWALFQAQLGLSKDSELYQLSDTLFSDDQETNRIQTFYQGVLDEIKTKLNNSIPEPKNVIYGHTHHPVMWQNKQELIPGVFFGNTGGWLTKENKGQAESFCGAAIYLYETGKEFQSISIEPKQ